MPGCTIHVFGGFGILLVWSVNDIHDGLFAILNVYSIKFCTFVQMHRNIKR